MLLYMIGLHIRFLVFSVDLIWTLNNVHHGVKGNFDLVLFNGKSEASDEA